MEESDVGSKDRSDILMVLLNYEHKQASLNKTAFMISGWNESSRIGMHKKKQLGR